MGIWTSKRIQPKGSLKLNEAFNVDKICDQVKGQTLEAQSTFFA